MSLAPRKWMALGVIGVAAALLLAWGTVAQSGPNVSASPIDQMTANAPGAAQAIGATFSVTVEVNTDNAQFSGYSAQVSYDSTVVNVNSITQLQPSGLTLCAAVGPIDNASNPGTAEDHGCATSSPPVGPMVADVTDFEFECIAAGTSSIHLVTLAEDPSFGTTEFDAGGSPITTTTIDDSVTCEQQSDLIVKKTDTGFDPVTVGSIATHEVLVTNLGPNAAVGANVTDDLPDSLDITTVSASLKIDADGDTTYEIDPAPCQLGVLPVLATSVNVVTCLLDDWTGSVPGLPASLAPGGKALLTVNYEVPLDDASTLEVDVAVAGVNCLASTLFGIGPPCVGDPQHPLSAGSVDPNPVDKESGGSGTPPLNTPGDADCFDVDVILASQTEPPLDGLVDLDGDTVPDVEYNMGCEITAVLDPVLTIDKDVDTDGDTVYGDSESVAGATADYRITITNNGPGAATGISLVDDVDDVGDLLLDASSIVVSTVNFDCSASNDTDAIVDEVNCSGGLTDEDGDTNLDDLAVGSSIQVDYQATYDAGLANVTVTNTAEVCWTDLTDPLNPEACAQDSVDVFVRPASATMEKDPAITNLWLCIDQSQDGVDNDGDSTVDNEAATCSGDNEGAIDITELARNVSDIDSPNDDDDGDGFPISPEYCLQFGCSPEQGAQVDHDGGEVGEGWAAYEFQIKFEHKYVDIDYEDLLGGDCDVTIITENWIMVGCVTLGSGGFGVSGLGPFTMGVIHVLPEPDLYLRLNPGKDNGVVTTLLDENCQWADALGDPMSGTLPGGLLPFCDDTTLTIRRLEGDIDTDCDVDILDEQAIAYRYGAFFGDLLYDDYYDFEPPVTGDFDIDIKDVQFVFGRDGSTCASPIPLQDPQGPPPYP